MPVNTSSTGATYGKSSDPLCPLGFHPQVRWPTRCKRCFRDYKEHSDSGDQKKFGNLTKTADEDPWTAKKSAFQKSKSVDVTIESGAGAASRFANYTTAASTSSQSKTEEDIPEWKKAMLERRKKEKEDEENKKRNFGFIPGTTLHSSVVNKTYDQDTRLNSWGSASNLRASNSYSNLTEEDTSTSYRSKRDSYTPSSTSSWSKQAATPAAVEKEAELSPYEKYLKRKKEQEQKDSEEKKRGEEEEERKRERERKREEERRKEEELEKERARQREKERKERELKRKEEERREKEAAEAEAAKKKAAAPTTRKWGSAAATTTPAAPAEPAKPKWGKAAVDEAAPAVKKKPWEKPSAAAKSSLPSLNEGPSKTSSLGKARKTSDSDSESLSTSRMASSVHSDSDHDGGVSKSEVEALRSELKAVKSRNDILEKLNKESSTKSNLTLESAKASEATSELMKARQKISEQETVLSSSSKEKKALNLKIKELESALERRPQVSETQKTISEMQTKLKFLEKKCEDLTHDNDDLRGNVQNLEVELEEVQDNFREDEADEYRTLKRELENSAKNCRVLQFKLKKSEKSLTDLEREKVDMETKLKGMSGGSSALDNLNKIRALEKDLESKSMHINRLEAEVKAGKSSSSIGGPRKGGMGPVLSRTGSVERSVEDQLLKDLQDSIEREADLKEQLNMAEDESSETRKKLSRLEDENESLANQVKKMAQKNKTPRRSPSPYNRNSYIEKDEGISEDGEELSATELKVQLEVAEGETGLLRKKVENLLTENLKITKEVKDISAKLNEEKKKKSTPSYSSYSSGSKASTSAQEAKIDELQTEINSFRVKLIEKDRELERLDAQVKSTKSSGKGSLIRSGSQDEDLMKKLNVIEKEAEVLRKKTAELEQENENLKGENKKLHSGYGKKPASTQEKLQMDKFTLEEKVKTLESKLKEANKKISDAEDISKSSMKTNLELDRLKRDKASLEADLGKLKDSAGSEKRKMEKLERDLSSSQEKAEKAQREIIASEREKRKADEEKNRYEAQVGRLETEIRSLTREKDRYRDESETARQKNRENLSQTQEGMKAFKDQIEVLKQELTDEKKSSKELRKQLEIKTSTGENETANLRREIDRKSSDIDEKVRKVRDLEEKISDIEEKFAKSKRINQQRKDKIDKLEAQLESSSGSGSRESAKELAASEAKVKELEKQLANSKPGDTKGMEAIKLKKEVETLKAENEDLTAKHEQLEEDYVVLKAKISTSKDEDYSTLKGELTTLRHTYNAKSDEWIKEKLDLEKKVKDLEQSIRSSAGNGWDAERNRFKSILDDRDSQITNLKIECDVARSQHTSVKKELEDVKQKLQDYEKMNRYGKSATDTNSSSDNSAMVDDLKKQLANEQKENKSQLNNTKMKYDSKIAIMSEEIHTLKSQTSKYRRERETYKEMFEGVQKKLTDVKGGKITPGDTADELNTARARISDMSYQLHVLEDELSESKMEANKAQANMMAQKSNYEIQVAELNSKINEMEEESLIDSGRARIAGTRTKMELAWQKERESQKKLINELNTMARDLKSTLLEVEKEKERDRLDSKRKIDAMKRAFEEEQDDTKKQITDLQYDLLELRDAHAKLRTTNEKLRRDKDRSVDDVRVQAKSRAEYGEEKKIARLISDMDEFISIIPKYLGDDIMHKEEKSSRASRLQDNEKSLAKMEFKTALFRVKETKEELEQLHRINEEELKRRSRRGESIETINEDSPARGRAGMRNASHSASSQKRALYRKAVSLSDGMAEPGAAGNLWQSKESLGSSESVASNASIPLPIPVRTRSARGGSESGYSSDTYNAMTIRRLERDTSVDRLSTGSRESTQSEWLPGEKKKSKGLLGKLKKIGRSMSTERSTGGEEREFGSGSDISTASKNSNVSSASKMSTSSKMSTASKMIARARSASKDRAGEKEKKTPFGPPGNANAAFDKYFDKASAPSPAATVTRATARPTATPTTTTTAAAATRTYRRF